ncbi:MAG TPA: reverse transcriptase family protein [Labilithrix sp.]|nr:reverse transcriptase family protein [Labilithrix sp.]
MPRTRSALASAFLAAGPWTEEGLVERGAVALGRRPRWLRTYVQKVLARFPEPPRHRYHELATFAPARRYRARVWLPPDVAMGERRWDVPAFDTPGDLALWLELTPEELEWFMDERGLERLRRDERLRHYRYRWIPKRRGGLRLLEAPKPRLKAILRRILTEILDAVPAHDAAHGFRRGRSNRSHALAHVGKRVVARFDLEDFFLSVSAARVAGIFRSFGYPTDVAWALAALATNVAPPSDWTFAPFTSHGEIARHRRVEALAQTRHLPQGAPTSPALANLAAFRLDVRLAALARTMDATYTRYADDLAFSGERVPTSTLVATIAADEGFALNHRKTRTMRRSVRQQVTGVVVNERLSVPRDVFDRLKATLHNCVRLGPGSQNHEGHADFRAHLRGRIAYVKSLATLRGEQLEREFDRIAWEDR